MLQIKDSVAVITGGASGIGLALSKYWLENGGKVVIGDVVESALNKVAEELKGDVATLLCNVTKEEDCARLADTAIEKFGQINLDAYIPCEQRESKDLLQLQVQMEAMEAPYGYLLYFWSPSKHTLIVKQRRKGCPTGRRARCGG